MYIALLQEVCQSAVRKVRTRWGSLSVLIALAAFCWVALLQCTNIYMVEDDGKTRIFTSIYDNVGLALAQQGYALGEHDSISGGPGVPRRQRVA